METETLNAQEIAPHRGPRFEIRELVSVRIFGGPAFLLNLGLGGAAIQAMEILEPGCLFSLAFSLPDSDSEVQGFGKVVWSDRSGRAGLKFVGISEFDRARLDNWVNGKQSVN